MGFLGLRYAARCTRPPRTGSVGVIEEIWHRADCTLHIIARAHTHTSNVEKNAETDPLRGIAEAEVLILQRLRCSGFCLAAGGRGSILRFLLWPASFHSNHEHEPERYQRLWPQGHSGLMEENGDIGGHIPSTQVLVVLVVAFLCSKSKPTKTTNPNTKIRLNPLFSAEGSTSWGGGPDPQSDAQGSSEVAAIILCTPLWNVAPSFWGIFDDFWGKQYSVAYP